MANIITLLKQSALVGRGGACFPTWLKWQLVKQARGGVKYVICNGSEGEPGVTKDGFILKHYPGQVINGIKIALKFFKAKTAYFYLNHKFYKRHKKTLIGLIGPEPIALFVKPISSGYIGGEETSLINAIEGKRIEPRLRPPFPPQAGLWGRPTLVNNVETFYAISKIAAGHYQNKRFISINGDCLQAGVFELPEQWTILKILKQTGNHPSFPFFIQVGGEASGLVLNSRQLNRPVSGSGSISVFSQEKYQPLDLIKGWLNFFQAESCGQCVPCREGALRLLEIARSPQPDWQLFADLLDSLSLSSFCGLGCAAPLAVRSYITNILVNLPENKINLPAGAKQTICQCFE